MAEAGPDAAPLVAVVSFKRVFDTHPLAERLPLPLFVAALRRFEVKEDTARAVERELARIARARDALQAGGSADGPVAQVLARAQAEARARGADPVRALAEVAARLEADARREAKRDLRLWSPAVYAPGAPRGSEGVRAISAMVLDYDRPVDPDEVRATWEAWFHVVHTTWSHTPSRPRLRVVVPLARLVDHADQPAAWDWAQARAGGLADPALKGAGATFALPAVPTRTTPCGTWVNGGPFLEPEEMGVFPGATSAESVPLGPIAESPWTRDDPRHDWVDAPEPD